MWWLPPEESIKDAAALVGAVTALAGFILAVWRIVRPVIARLKAILTAIEAVNAQLMPNGGGSLRDAVDRQERAITTVHSRLQGLAEEAHLLRQIVELSLEADPRVAVFQSGAHGECVFVNQTMAEWTGMASVDARGNGWVGFLPPEDRDAVFSEWEAAVRQGRRFSLDFRYQHIRTGETIAIRCTASPLRNLAGEVCGWRGTSTLLDDADAARRPLRHHPRKAP